MSYENFPIAVVDNGGQWTHRDIEYSTIWVVGLKLFQMSLQ